MIRLFILIASCLFCSTGLSANIEFPYKNVVWAEPNCENPQRMVTWSGGQTLFRYEIENNSLFKTKVDSIDTGPLGEALAVKKIDSNSREVVFNYEQLNLTELYIMNNTSAQMQLRYKGNNQEAGRPGKMLSCGSNSNAAKTLFQSINLSSSKNQSSQTVSVVDIMADKERYKNSIVQVSCALEFANADYINCVSSSNDRHRITIDSKTMYKTDLRWALENCSDTTKNYFMCQHKKIEGRVQPNGKYAISNARFLD